MMCNSNITKAFLVLARAMNNQSKLSSIPRVSVVERTMTCRFRDFVRMNPPIFLGFKMVEDRQ